MKADPLTNNRPLKGDTHNYCKLQGKARDDGAGINLDRLNRRFCANHIDQDQTNIQTSYPHLLSACQ
jgi:hypothetical protein